MAELEYVPEKDRWRCRLCDTHYVVPSLARDCEAKHMTEEDGSG